MKRTAIVTAAIGAALSVASVAPAHAEVAPNTHVYRITTCSSYGSVATCRQKEIVESPGSYRWHARHLILSGGGVIDRSAWGGWHVEQMQQTMSNAREGYDWWPQQGVRQMYCCHTCGAMVGDTEGHDAWHEGIANLVLYVSGTDGQKPVRLPKTEGY